MMMTIKKLLSIIALLLFFCSAAHAQDSKTYVRHGTGAPSICTLGTAYVDDATGHVYVNKLGSCQDVASTVTPTPPGGTNGQVQYRVNSTTFGGFTVGGDCTLNTSTGTITCTKTNGVSFATVATSGAKNDVGLGNVDNTSDATKNSAAASLTNKKLGSLTTNGPVFTSGGDGTLNSEAQLSSARGGTGSAFFGIAGPTALRAFTFPDANATIARADAAQTLNGTQTLAGDINFDANNTRDIGTSANKARNVYVAGFIQTPNGRIANDGVIGGLITQNNIGGISHHTALDFHINTNASICSTASGVIVVGVYGANCGSGGGTFRHVATSPTQITANQNDYNPGGVSYFQRWSSDAARSVTGLTFTAAQADGQVYVVVNVGAQNIVLVNQSASSTSANRFLNSSGADITLSANQAADLIYDGTQSRWLVFKRN
jgi:hypothetical protein